MVNKAWYMHPNAMDVCLVLYDNNSAEWWNLGYTGTPYRICDAPLPPNLHEFINISAFYDEKRTEPGLPPSLKRESRILKRFSKD